MIEILKKYKGKVIHFSLTGSDNRYTALVRKINEVDGILEVNTWRELGFVKINLISFIIEANSESEPIVKHVVPDAFT